MSPQEQFAVVVPVKTLSRAKSRLEGYPDAVRRDLVRAFALDALAAALSATLVAGVHVVTDDADLAEAARGLGCGVLADVGGGDLNRALRAAVAALATDSSSAGPVAAMLGDLPCLLPQDLDAALGTVQDAAFVADAVGTGTTLLAVRDRARFDPRFGAGSRAAHLRSGAFEVGLLVRSLRRDVDTAADLIAASDLGVGAHTRLVLDRA